MTKDECAQVTSIDTSAMPFYRIDVYRFDEFQHFTGLDQVRYLLTDRAVETNPLSILDSITIPANVRFIDQANFERRRIRKIVFLGPLRFNPSYAYAYNNKFNGKWLDGWKVYYPFDTVPWTLVKDAVIASEGTLYVKTTSLVDEQAVAKIAAAGCSISYTL